MLEGTSNRSGGLQSVSTALDLLGCFDAAEELGVSDLARRLCVAKSTAHRLVTTLCARGFVERNPETGRYRLGIRLYELGALVMSHHRLRRTAMPLLQELREQTGSTIHLAVADGAEIIHLERLDSARCMPMFAGIKRRFDVHSTSCGKAIAAFDPVCAAARFRAGFPAYTRFTIRNARDFERELVLTRRRGFALNQGETRLGITAIGAPVLDSCGHAIASLSIAAPTSDAERHLNQYARLVTLSATKLGKSVGA